MLRGEGAEVWSNDRNPACARILEADLGFRKKRKKIIRFLVSNSYFKMLSNIIKFRNGINADKITKKITASNH